MSTPIPTTSAPALIERLRTLRAERALAAAQGLTADPAYAADVDDEIAACRQAYVGMAVTEIATLRAELSGPLLG